MCMYYIYGIYDIVDINGSDSYMVEPNPTVIRTNRTIRTLILCIIVTPYPWPTEPL